MASDEQILAALNDAVSTLPVSIGDSTAYTEPVVFICGAPRSGTTLLYQLLAYAGEVGYVNNLMARFYANPPLGAWLSEQAQIDRVFLPKSVYGRTFGASSPHEFGRFWLDAFGLDQIGEPDDPVDPARVAHAADRIRQIGAVFNRPLVFKSFDYLWFIDELAEALPATRWIHIVRERDANVASLATLYETRAVDGVAPTWSSATLARTRARASALPLLERVAAQIDDLNDYLTAALGRRPVDQVATVELARLTAEPGAVISELCDHLGIAWSTERLTTAVSILAQ